MSCPVPWKTTPDEQTSSFPSGARHPGALPSPEFNPGIASNLLN